jgi:hypothetical protein
MGEPRAGARRWTTLSLGARWACAATEPAPCRARATLVIGLCLDSLRKPDLQEWRAGWRGAGLKWIRRGSGASGDKSGSGFIAWRAASSPDRFYPGIDKSTCWGLDWRRSSPLGEARFKHWSSIWMESLTVICLHASCLWNSLEPRSLTSSIRFPDPNPHAFATLFGPPTRCNIIAFVCICRDLLDIRVCNLEHRNSMVFTYLF